MRSSFLVHWTGKRIGCGVKALADEDRHKYVGRLRSILMDGFWMTKPSESLHGRVESAVTYEVPMTCFTEIRLSAAGKHACRYGRLGIAVNRDFVLDRLGGPVHYVRNHPNEAIVGNVNELLKHLNEELSSEKRKEELLSYFGINTCFLKAMSDKDTDNFMYLDEQEWRIVHTHIAQEAGLIRKSRESKPSHVLPLEPGDIRLLVFPDSLTLQLATQDKEVATWLAKSERLPALLTLEECGQF